MYSLFTSLDILVCRSEVTINQIINQALEVARSEVNSHNYFLCKSTIFNGRIFHKIIKGLLISICIWEYYTKGSGTLLSICHEY